ncbi:MULTISPECIES: ABC transporter ATP-binding protein [unclassified Meridianimarinicoccus]|uniref:ABC transporter ATP-binding protein n=1 Tax=unclassified Meridianimarinicoccus TaxID=2923344 RepID=UPI001868A4C0|nr:ABC transporter ATP-binding protein [Fluviibacterium sp. MJW13]
MIEFRNLTKSYRTDAGRKVVLDNCTITFPSGKVIGLLGRNGAGKSTLLRLIAGTQDVDSGEIIRHGTVSYPIGFAGSFHPDLTGAQNARFVARIYGADTDALADYVMDFTELGEFYHMPLRTYSSGMRARLAFGISMGLPFDTYLIDEVTSVGDQAFRDKAERVFKSKISSAGAIMVSHGMGQIRSMCDEAAVLDRGKMTYFDNVNDAIAFHERNMREQQR